ncbi:MAG: hypothetical protein PHQ75_11165, partial [Thermoguttaceae bacterium]|nr:hypothetical protein [Thermoguttaceae bacterium]
MKKKLYPFTSSAWIALGLALGLWLDGTVPAAGQQSPVQQPVRYSTANQTLSAPVRVSFNPPAAPNSAQNPKYTVQGRQVRQAGSSSGKMKFAFSNKHDQQWEVPANPVIPTQPHPNQIAAKRRQLGRQGNPGRQTASIPYRSPILAPNIPAQTLQVSTQPRQVRQAAQTPVQAPNSRQYIQVPQQSQASPRAIVPTPRLFNEAMASGQYDGYLVVSDQEYMLMQQGRMPQIDPSRVHSFAYYSKTRQPSSLGANTGMTSYSPVADYEDMLDRMEFSLAKLPRSPHAVELSPPSAASVWTRFFTGQQSDEIRSWKN